MLFGSAHSQVTMISLNDIYRMPTSVTKIELFAIVRSQRNVALRNIEAIAAAL